MTLFILEDTQDGSPVGPPIAITTYPFVVVEEALIYKLPMLFEA